MWVHQSLRMGLTLKEYLFFYINFLYYLTGNVINIQSGKWVGFMSGLGAGLDSFYEYLLKVIILCFSVFCLIAV